MKRLELNFPWILIYRGTWSSLLTNLALPTTFFGEWTRFDYITKSEETSGIKKKNNHKSGLRPLIHSSSMVNHIYFLYPFSRSMLAHWIPLVYLDTSILILTIIFFTFIMWIKLFKTDWIQYLKCIFCTEVMMQSLIISFFVPGIVFICAQSLSISFPLSTYLGLAPLILVTYIIPITINGWGLREGLLIALAPQLGISVTKVISLSIMTGLILTLTGILGGLLHFYIFYNSKKKYEIETRSFKYALVVLCSSCLVFFKFHLFILWLTASYSLIRFLTLTFESQKWINPANILTFMRLILLGILVFLTTEKNLFFILGSTLLVLDGIDGFLARKLHCTSDLGARFDMEVDALTMLIISLTLVTQLDLPIWISLIGFMRYIFACWRFFLSPPNQEEKKKKRTMDFSSYLQRLTSRSSPSSVLCKLHLNVCFITFVPIL